MEAAALGDGGEAGGAIGDDGGAAQIRNAQVLEEGGGRRDTYRGAPFVPGEATTRDKRAFCPGSWLHPGQKVILGGPGEFPARGPHLVPGGSTIRDKRGPFSLVPAKSYVCFCFFLLLF